MGTALQKIATQVNETGKLPTITPGDLKPGWVLKKLSQKHKHIIALHLQGVSRFDIGSVCGCTPEYVSMVVKQPLAQEYLRQVEAHMDEQLRVAGIRGTEVLLEKLDSTDEEIQLKAARLALESQGKLKPSDSKQKSAEDVVASLLAHATTVIVGTNVQVNQGD